MTFTNHAQVRANQRGLPLRAFETIERYGFARRRNDAVEYVITSRAAMAAIAELKREIQLIERFKNKSFIVDGDTIITVFPSREKWRTK